MYENLNVKSRAGLHLGDTASQTHTGILTFKLLLKLILLLLSTVVSCQLRSAAVEQVQLSLGHASVK